LKKNIKYVKILLKTEKLVNFMNISSLQAEIYFVKIANRIKKFVKL